MPATEPPTEPPPGTATQAPPLFGFVLVLGAFAVVYWVMRAWFTRVTE